MRNILVAIAGFLLFMGFASASPIYIAQGDQAYISVNHPSGTCWYFPDSERIEQTKLYDLPAVHSGENWSCELTRTQSGNMREGDYTLVYTYPSALMGAMPPRYLKDITWQNNSLVQVYGRTKDETGMQAARVMQDLKQMTNSSILDNLEEYQISIQAPVLTILKNDPGINEERIVSGESNMQDGTPITIVVDEMDHTKKELLQSFTFHTAVSRPYMAELGTWKTNMSLPIQDMAPGWHQMVVYCGGLQTSARFPIYQGWEAIPTPVQYINYFGNGSIKPVIIIQTVIQRETVYQDRWHTATPTPAITDVLGEKIPYPYKTGDVIPPWVGVAGLVVIGGIVLWRDYKWK